jgi:4-oxalocrotonate tautomerase
MPFVNVKLTPKSPQQMKTMAAKITKVIEETCHVPPNGIWVTFEEIPEEQWAVGGKLLKEPE